MTQPEFFWYGFLSLLLVVGGVREIRRGNGGLGTVLLGLPVVAWLSLLWRPA